MLNFTNRKNCCNTEKFSKSAPYEVLVNSINVTGKLIQEWMQVCIQALEQYPKSILPKFSLEALQSTGFEVQVVMSSTELKRRLQTATEREKVSLYAKLGYWQDAITTLGQLRRQSQKDTTLIEDCKTLLNSVDLENIAAEPISPCCKPK